MQLTLRCEPMMKPIPADTSQVNDPDWTLFCAWAGADSTAATAKAVKVEKMRNI